MRTKVSHIPTLSSVPYCLDFLMRECLLLHAPPERLL